MDGAIGVGIGIGVGKWEVCVIIMWWHETLGGFGVGVWLGESLGDAYVIFGDD